jgi:lipopolysaccharide transport system ATP-binding protein
MQPAIRVENLGKRYRINHDGQPHGRYRTFRDTLTDVAMYPIRRWKSGGEASRQEDFWALKDVCLDVAPGEVAGIVGRNGAGKSTLLKILSRITKPTSGQVVLNGRIGSLLEVGTGFHPELTGRENIFLNGSILGMTRKEIRKQFDAIVDFSGVEKFLDTPVKRYSSGMYVRLAFAVAAHLDLEIMVVDEVLAVGDSAFQQKCLGKMGEIAHGGRTVLLVSHNLPMLSNLCTRAAWLHQGRLEACGSCKDIIAAYCQHNSNSAVHGSTVSLADHPGRARGYQHLVRRITLLDDRGEPTSSVPLGGSLTVDLEFTRLPQRAETGVVVEFCDQFGTLLGRANSREQSRIDFTSGPRHHLRCTVDNIRFLPGAYSLTVAVDNTSDYLDRIEGVISFTVEPVDIYGTGRLPSLRHGIFALEARWQDQKNGGETQSSVNYAK